MGVFVLVHGGLCEEMYGKMKKFVVNWIHIGLFKFLHPMELIYRIFGNLTQMKISKLDFSSKHTRKKKLGDTFVLYIYIYKYRILYLSLYRPKIYFLFSTNCSIILLLLFFCCCCSCCLNNLKAHYLLYYSVFVQLKLDWALLPCFDKYCRWNIMILISVY